MPVKINMDMPKSCWRCIFGSHDLAKRDTLCVIIFRKRNDVWDMPKRVPEGEKHEDCPLKECK